MGDEAVVKRADGWFTGRVGDETLMMNGDTGLYLALSTVGSAIWDLVETPMNADGICHRLLQRFDVPAETCRAEVDVFLADMQERGALLLERA